MKTLTMKFRARYGLSQAALARLLPVSVRTLQDWESERGQGKAPEYLTRALNDLSRELSNGKVAASKKTKAKK